MLYKQLINYNLLIINLIFLQIVTCSAIIDSQHDLSTTESKIQVSKNEYIATEYSPLLPDCYIIINYNTINGDNKKNVNYDYYLNRYLDKKNRYNNFLVFSTILLFFIGISLLSFKYIEGFFILIVALFNVLIIRKCIINYFIVSYSNAIQS